MIDYDQIDTLWDVVAWHATANPGTVALRFEGRDTSYGALILAASDMAGALERKGIRPGDRIGFLGKNSDRYFVLLYAVARLSAVLVPLNCRLVPDEWEAILRDSGVVRLFVDDEFRDRAAILARRIGLPPVTAILDDRAGRQPAASLPGADDVVFQVYTSGTTGRPKGAMLTHRNLLALRAPGYQAGLQWFPGPDDICLAVLPVAHIAGTAWALFGLYAGARLVIGREFRPDTALAMIEGEKVSHMLLAPAVMQQMLDDPGVATTDFTSLRIVTYGASPISQALLRRAIDVFGCGFVQMYGMTEAAGGVVALSPEDHVSQDAKRLQAAGRAMPGVDIMIVDEQGERLPANAVGEIAVRSAAVMKGYWKRPQDTLDVMDEAGWLRTGDVGHLDANGYLFILDRLKDVIVSGGENVYPAEVENALFGHPDVADVAVIGVPSTRWGEEVMAVVVPHAGCSPDLASLAAWARERIAAFKVPKQLSIVAKLPRNAGNKVLRRELREPFWNTLDRRVN